MLKRFESFEHDPIWDYIIGIPSGEVIDVNDDDIVTLKKQRLLKFERNLKCFTFLDQNYKMVRKHLITEERLDKIKSFFDSIDVSMKFVEIHDDMSVSVHADVDMSQKGLTSIPVKFVTVDGDFDCSLNKLNNLYNAPSFVTGDFDCSCNKIYTLIDGPTHVAGGYYCSENFLTTLDGYPILCKRAFDASKNHIYTLKGVPEVIEAKFFKIANNKLKSLIGGPKRAFNFDCSFNQITTLVKGLEICEGNFDCTHNRLYNLLGMPKCNRIFYEEGNQVDERG